MKQSFPRKHLAAGLTTLALTCALALAGCANTPAAPSQGSSAAPSPSAPASAAPSPSQTASSPFQAGTWLSDRGQYWFFDADGASGRTASLADGAGVGFTYTLDGAQADFSMGGADSTQSCQFTLGADTITFQWSDGETELLRYVSSQGSEEFQFYSNLALEEMALTYFRSGADGQDGEGLTAASQTNEDGTVTIQVYQNLGDHNSTAAWYTVDRVTAQGTDGNGQAVDLDG